MKNAAFRIERFESLWNLFRFLMLVFQLNGQTSDEIAQSHQKSRIGEVERLIDETIDRRLLRVPRDRRARTDFLFELLKGRFHSDEFRRENSQKIVFARLRGVFPVQRAEQRRQDA